MNEQQPEFPKEAEINKAIDKWVEQFFQDSFFENNKEEKIKTIFNTEIREYQSRNNDSLQPLNIEKLTSIVKQELKNKTKAFLGKIKQQKQYNGNKFIIDKADTHGVVLKTNDGEQEITLISSLYGDSHDYRYGLWTYKPPTTPIIKLVHNNEYKNRLEKFVSYEYDKSVCIGNTFRVNYSNEQEYKDNKMDDIWITFNKDDKGQINHIKLLRQWTIINTGRRITRNITEIELQDNKISKIDEYTNVNNEERVANGMYETMRRTNPEPQVESITDNEAIEKKIKDIFSNKDDIAIQNILYELDEEQRKAITNNYTIDVLFPKSNSSSLDEDGPKSNSSSLDEDGPKSSSPSLDDGGCCQCNICNCNLDCLNCFSGIFNSKN